MQKINKFSIALNIISIIAILALFSITLSLQKQIDGAFDSIKNHRDVYLESDLRHRGIIDGELIGEGNYKPYSLEQMEQFQNWVKNK